MAATTTISRMAQQKPDRDNWFIEPVVAGWWEEYVGGGNMQKDFALPGSRFRASWAGDCSRSLAYHLAGVEETDPPTVADAWRFNIGTLLHEHVQATVERAFPGSSSEVKVRIGTDGSGHMDMLVVKPDGKRVSVEIKTVNGFGFKKMVGEEGPRIKYVMQGALNAAAMDPIPDELVIAVFSLECMSPGEARKHGLNDEYRRFAGQWTFDQETFLPIAERERNRVEAIMAKVDAEGPTSVRRIIPDPSLPRHVVINPDKGLLELRDARGEAVGLGHTWHCGYCPFQTQCCEDAERGR